MLKNTLLFFTVLLFTGCAERGYTITTNQTTQTITTESISTIGEKSQEESFDIIEKMKTSINKAYEKQKNVRKVKKETKKTSSTSEKVIKKTNDIVSKKDVRENEVIFKIPEQTKNAPDAVNINTNETERLKEEARKSKKLREAKIQEARKFMGQPIKEVETSTEVTLEAETKKEEQEQKRKAFAAQKALDAKVLKESLLQAKNTEKQTTNKPLRATNTSSIQALTFMPIDKVYHKFGTSEVHGHVIYIDPSGQERRLAQTKIYLLPVSAKLNHWFQNFYLKNKSGSKIVVNYLNKASLNIEKNFEFYGVAKGSYYVIIESNNPSSGKNDKVYISKKIQVGKHKKIMGVFSKKL